MARILMVWELGAGYGHLAPLLSLARPLQAEGHTVMFAVRDLNVAQALLGGSGMPYFQAPANFGPRQGEKLHSYAQLLLNTAFNTPDELLARARAWRALYALLEPDILVCDHSPTALLAARGLPIRCVIIGNGFSIPPDVEPLPELRAWAPADPQQLLRDEARALDQANAALRALRAPSLPRLSSLSADAAPVLFTLQELDNYAGLRGGVDYWGAPPASGGAAPQWPEGPGKRVFCYCRPFAALEHVLADLDRSGYNCLVYMPRLPAEERSRMRSGRVHFADALLDIGAVGRDCDGALMTNGHGTTATILLAGKPVMLLPQYLEMMLIAKSVEQQGAGLMAAEFKPEVIGPRLKRVLEEDSFGQAARTMAERYRGLLQPGAAHRNFQALITRLAAESL